MREMTAAAQPALSLPQHEGHRDGGSRQGKRRKGWRERERSERSGRRSEWWNSFEVRIPRTELEIPRTRPRPEPSAAASLSTQSLAATRAVWRSIENLVDCDFDAATMGAPHCWWTDKDEQTNGAMCRQVHFDPFDTDGRLHSIAPSSCLVQYPTHARLLL